MRRGLALLGFIVALLFLAYALSRYRAYLAALAADPRRRRAAQREINRRQALRVMADAIVAVRSRR